MTSRLRVIALMGLLLCWPAVAQEDHPRHIAEIELHTADEFYRLLLRAEQLLSSGALAFNDPAPVTFVLHGPEVRILLRQNYLENKVAVDLAASLSALGVVDIKACETWIGGDGIAVEDLQPFVGTVAYGLAEINRLVEEENYLSF
jgi:intracellular sulfur oxidation DsrE/DsrF family protein